MGPDYNRLVLEGGGRYNRFVILFHVFAKLKLMTELSEIDAATMAAINTQTARISWHELQRFFATGNCVYVAPELDLVAVAYYFAKDDAARIKTWMDSNQLGRVTDEQAKTWLVEEADLWSVVIKPWVLLQREKQI